MPICSKCSKPVFQVTSEGLCKNCSPKRPDPSHSFDENKRKARCTKCFRRKDNPQIIFPCPKE